MRALAATEHELQVTVCDYLRLSAYPSMYWFAIPNGGKRHFSVANKLKKEGVKAGVPDLAFLLPEGRMAWLEMKTRKGRLSPDQIAFRDRAISLGHTWGMAKTFNEATQFLASIGAIKGTPK